MSTWIPQNLQKRILLYVLQQLSLFSEIDLPNLETVSLNTIQLKDVSIDPEKAGKLPGCNLRYGSVGNLELSGGVMGGVNIDASNIDLVISPTLDVNEDLSKSMSSIVQTTADLASTIILEENSELESELEQELNQQKEETKGKPSALGGVMARAVELALSRLQININNLNLKIVSETTDLLVKIDNISIGSVNGTRSVKSKGISVIVLKPDVDGGQEEQDSKDDESIHKDDDISDKDSEEEDDDQNDYDQSLMDSMVFTHEEASSMYMSATSQSFINPNQDITNKPVILYLNELETEFEGLSEISDLTIVIDQVIMSSNPLISTILSIFNGITRNLKLKTYQKRKHSLFTTKVSEDSQEEEEVSNSETTNLFNKFHISSLIVSLTSAINNGKLASPKNNVYINLENFSLKQKHDDLVYGGIEIFKMIQTINGEVHPIIYFEDPKVQKADIRFEMFNKISSDFKGKEYTLLLSKVLKIGLNSHCIGELIKLFESIKLLSTQFTSLMTAIQSHNQLFKPKVPKKPLDTQVIIQTSNIEASVQLSQLKVSLDILPISFNLLNNGLKCSKIGIGLWDKNQHKKIGTISNIIMLIKPQIIKAHLTSNSYYSKVINVSSSLNFKVSKFDLDLEFLELKQLLENVNELASEVNGIMKKFIVAETSRGTQTLKGSIQASTYNNKRRNHVMINRYICELYFRMDEFKAVIRNVDNFGDINVETNNFQVYNINGDVYYIVKGFEVGRIPGGSPGGSPGDTETQTRDRPPKKMEKIIYNYILISDPIIIGVLKSSGGFEIKFNSLIIDYYTYWQELFESSPPTQDPNTTPTTTKLDLRLEFINCLIGLNPYQLSCKALILINKMSSDIMISETIYIKSTIRDLTLLLIDDVANLGTMNTMKHNVVDMLIGQGYLVLGNINNLHIGITYNSNEAVLLEKTNQYNKLSIVDIKVNMDEINIESCGDSFYTLVQVINDLKIPIILKDEDKFKVEVKEDINLMEGIEEMELGRRDGFSFGLGSDLTSELESSGREPVRQDNGNFEIIDDYKDLIDDFTELDMGVEPSKQSPIESVIEPDDHYFNKIIGNDKPSISPITININIGKFNLYMYDGYDWKQTRKVIKGVIKKVEHSEIPEAKNQDDQEDDKLEIIEETLFRSIHVTFPKGINPQELTTNINKQVNETETEVDPNSENNRGYKDLKLRRSNKYKILIELRNIDIIVNIKSLRDPINQPIEEEYEVVNEIELIVDLLTIYDNLVSSTWNKYLSYMNSLGEKEIGKNMIHLNITTVRSPANFNFNETLIKLGILPVRLFIDQDANEFLTRFFKFNDPRFDLPKIDEDIYIKKFEINKDLKFKIDYKPKKLNLTGLKNGEFNQLLNLININGLTVNLSSIKLYGLKGMDGLFVHLFSHWLPHIQNTQLLQLINGVELFKPFINITESFKNILSVPIGDEDYYKKVNKQGQNFLKITSFELLKLGYKLSNGTQNLLEQGEEILGGIGSKSRKLNNTKPIINEHQDSSEDDEEPNLLANSMRLNRSTQIESNNIYNPLHTKKYGDIEDNHYLEDSEDEEIDESKLISLYSNQPKNFKQGISYSFDSIGKNYNLTKNEFISLIEKFNQSDNYEESMKILLKKSPLLILRPLIGTTEVLSKTLMGLSNEINSIDQIESKDKYR